METTHRSRLFLRRFHVVASIQTDDPYIYLLPTTLREENGDHSPTTVRGTVRTPTTAKGGGNDNVLQANANRVVPPVSPAVLQP